jgi:hypothetical protein
MFLYHSVTLLSLLQVELLNDGKLLPASLRLPFDIRVILKNKVYSRIMTIFLELCLKKAQRNSIKLLQNFLVEKYFEKTVFYV